MRRIGIFLRSVALPVCVALLLAILFRPMKEVIKSVKDKDKAK